MDLSKQKEKEISKFLSYVLRHKPEAIGLNLEHDGWASVDELLQKSNIDFNKEQLHFVVNSNDKKRFAFNVDFSKIRANQGHSIDVNLGLEPHTPPDILYHGTASKNLLSIQQKGLLKQNRQFVHLSKDYETAHKVGMRYGKPVVLTVNAKDMHNKGHSFFLSKNGVWLTDFVDAIYIDLKTV